MNRAQRIGLTLIVGLIGLGILLNVATARAADEPHAEITNIGPTGISTASNYPPIKWTSVFGWTVDNLRIASSDEVDGDGKLVDRVAVIPGVEQFEGEDFPVSDTSFWKLNHEGEALFPGTYWAQLLVKADDGSGAEWTAPRKIVVKRYANRPKGVAGDDYTDSPGEFPYTLKMHTNVRSVPLRMVVTVNGHKLCSSSKPMLFVPGSEGTASREVVCSYKAADFNAKGHNKVHLVVVAGSKATTGRVWRIAIDDIA